MPGLELTMPQAVRLWSLGPDDCRSIVDALVDAGFLTWTARRTIVRTERDMRMREAWIDASHIPVRTATKRDKLVGLD